MSVLTLFPGSGGERKEGGLYWNASVACSCGGWRFLRKIALVKSKECVCGRAWPNTILEKAKAFATESRRGGKGARGEKTEERRDKGGGKGAKGDKSGSKGGIRIAGDSGKADKQEGETDTSSQGSGSRSSVSSWASTPRTAEDFKKILLEASKAARAKGVLGDDLLATQIENMEFKEPPPEEDSGGSEETLLPAQQEASRAASRLNWALGATRRLYDQRLSAKKRIDTLNENLAKEEAWLEEIEGKMLTKEAEVKEATEAMQKAQKRLADEKDLDEKKSDKEGEQTSASKARSGKGTGDRHKKEEQPEWEKKIWQHFGDMVEEHIRKTREALQKAQEEGEMQPMEVEDALGDAAPFKRAIQESLDNVEEQQRQRRQRTLQSLSPETGGASEEATRLLEEQRRAAEEAAARAERESTAARAAAALAQAIPAGGLEPQVLV